MPASTASETPNGLGDGTSHRPSQHLVLTRKQLRFLLVVAGIWLAAILAVSLVFYNMSDDFRETRDNVEKLEGELQQVKGKANSAIESMQNAEAILKQVTSKLETTQAQVDSRVGDLTAQIARIESEAKESRRRAQESVDLLKETLDKQVKKAVKESESELAAARNASTQAGLDAKKARQAAEVANEKLDEIELQFEDQEKEFEASVYRSGFYLLVTSDPNPLITLGLVIYASPIIRPTPEKPIKRLRVVSLDDPSYQLWPELAGKDQDRPGFETSGSVKIGGAISFHDAGNNCRFELRPTFYHWHWFTTDLIGTEITWKDASGPGSCTLRAVSGIDER